MKLTVFLVTGLLSRLLSSGQTDWMLHQKYQVYKNRLHTQFMFYNETNPYEQGAFIPATKINTATKTIVFGDATIFLANYIQVLATEYAYLNLTHKPVDATLYELYQAIETFERLDRNGEFSFRNNGSGPSDMDINGFFIRDDVDSNFIRRNWQCIYGIDSTWTVTSDFASRQRFLAGKQKDGEYSLEMSKDQCWHLYLGFALVSKLLDGVELCDTLDHCYNFSNRVKQITKNIHFQLTGAANENHAWEIYNPVNGHEIPENRGGKVRLYSYGFGIAAGEITGKKMHAWHSRSAWWRKVYLSAWKWKDWDADDFGARALASVGWVRGINNYKRLLDETVQKQIYSYPQLPLIHLLLYPGKYDETDWATADSLVSTFYKYLVEAPADGPGFGAPEYWTTISNTVWPERRHQAVEGDKFNGLDYLLIHNLYYLFHLKDNTIQHNKRQMDDIDFNKKRILPFQLNQHSSAYQAN
jgi:hypothetical protein